jgi:hypothetical protein
MNPSLDLHHDMMLADLDEQRSDVRRATDSFLFVVRLQLVLSSIQLAFCALAAVAFYLLGPSPVIRDGLISFEQPGLIKATIDGFGAMITVVLATTVLRTVKRTHEARTSFFCDQRKHYRRLQDEPDLENIVAKLANTLGLHGLHIWVDPKNFARTAYVADSGNETQVIIANGLCVLAEQDYGAAEAIVAHELSHVRFNDWFWFDVEALASAVEGALAPILWLEVVLGSFVMVFVLSSPSQGSALALAIGSFMVGSFLLGPSVVGLIRLRRVSTTARKGIRSVELSADIGALYCVKPDAILRVFALEKGHPHDHNHPSWEERTKSILYAKKHFEAQCGRGIHNSRVVSELTSNLLDDPEINSIRGGIDNQRK